MLDLGNSNPDKLLHLDTEENEPWRRARQAVIDSLDGRDGNGEAKVFSGSYYDPELDEHMTVIAQNDQYILFPTKGVGPVIIGLLDLLMVEDPDTSAASDRQSAGRKPN